MNFLALFTILVCVSLKIDAFPQQNPAQISENASNTVSNVPKIESTEAIKAVESKSDVQSASPAEQSNVPVPLPVPVPSEQKETSANNTDVSKQNNGKPSSINPEPKAEKSDDVNIKPKEANLTDVKIVDDVLKNRTEPKLIGSTTGKSSVQNVEDNSEEAIESEGFEEAIEAAEPESSDEDKDFSATISGSYGYLNVSDFIQRIQDRIRTLVQQMGKMFESEENSEISFEDADESEEGRHINFPDFSIYNSDELQ